MKFIDLFSGIGGFTRGLKLAGHECVGHCEFDRFAEASYRSKDKFRIDIKIRKKKSWKKTVRIRGENWQLKKPLFWNKSLAKMIY